MPRFAIRRVRTGPGELRTQLPVTGQAVATRTDPSGVRDFVYAVLDKPVKYRIPPQFSRDRYRSQDLDRDEQGAFVWISAVTFRAHATRENPYTGMRDFAVDLAYVVDPTVEQDEELTLAKVAPVAVVEIDDDHKASRQAAVVPSDSPGGLRPPAVPPEQFRHELGVLLAALATLAGERVTEVVVPPQVPATDDAEGRAAYVLGEDGLRYQGWDPMSAAWAWRTTADPEELTYWIVDDIASALAWDWAQNQPTFGALDEEQQVDQLWMPRWQYLMGALRPAWGDRTATTIQSLAQADSSQTWESLFADAAPAVAATPPDDVPTPEPPAEDPSPARDVPWGAGASKGPPAETFMPDERSSNRKRQVLLGVVAAVVLASVLFLLFRDGGTETDANQTPAVTSTPASTPASTTPTTRVTDGDVLTSGPAPSPTEAPPAPPPPPGDANQITPRPTATYTPTRRPTSTQDDDDEEEEETRTTRRPPPTLFTPPVTADPWIGAG